MRIFIEMCSRVLKERIRKIESIVKNVGVREGKKRRPKTFFIKHKKTRRQQSEFDRLSVPLRHLPENISSIIIDCPSCKAKFHPNWFEKHELSMVPVKPKYKSKGVKYTGPARWILKQVSQNCPNCGASVMISMPVNKIKTIGSLFGDDAARDYRNKIVYIYSLIGADQKLLPEFEENINSLKRDLFPSIDPENWKIHMKEMWAGSRRKKILFTDHSVLTPL
jgi:hypothetical protein